MKKAKPFIFENREWPSVLAASRHYKVCSQTIRDWVRGGHNKRPENAGRYKSTIEIDYPHKTGYQILDRFTLGNKCFKQKRAVDDE